MEINDRCMQLRMNRHKFIPLTVRTSPVFLGAHPEAAMKAIGILSARVRALGRILVGLTSDNVETRIARLLMRFAAISSGARVCNDATDGELCVNVRLTHQDIANLIGASRQTVSTTLAHLRNRQPAAFCGVVGIKPTYGRVSRYGLVAFASSLDQVGTMGRTVKDAAHLLTVVSGHDPRDATSASVAVPDFSAAVGRGVSGLVVGVPTECMPDELDSEVRGLVEGALRDLAARGAEIRPVSLPSTDLGIACYYVLAPAEASSNLARYDGVRFGRRAEADDLVAMYEQTRSAFLGAEVKRRIVLGTYALSAGYYEAYYGKAQRARSVITAELGAAFEDGVDVLFTPTTPTAAFRLGAHAERPIDMYLSDVFTVNANLSGIPAISVPVGEADGLPVGGQILAPWWKEEVAIAVAGAVEADRGAAS